MRYSIKIFSLVFLLAISFSASASSINYDFTTDTSAVTVNGAPSSIEDGSLKIIVDENSTKWSVRMKVMVNSDIFDNPVLEMKLKVGTKADAVVNFPVTLMIDSIYTANGDEGQWRIYPALNLNTTEWQYLNVDLSPLISSWEATHGEEHGNIQELTITIGTNNRPFVSEELYIDYIRMGDKLHAKSSELNPENPQEVLVDLGLPATGNATVSNFTLKRNGISINVDSVFIRDESCLVLLLENPVEIPREVADKPTLEISYNGNDEIKDAGGIILEPFELPISIQSAVENRWKYWGKYIFSDLPREAEWISQDTIIDDWDWSVPEFVTADSLAYLWFRSDPNTDFSCKNLNSVYIQWNELEPVQGEYKFDMLRQQIKDAAVGYDGVTVRLLAAVWKWETFPEPGGDVPDWLASRTSAPRWMDEMDIAKIPMDDEGVVAINMDIMDPDYHELYKKLIRALGESGIPNMPELKIVNVCYRSRSAGEEYTKYDPKNNAVEAQYSAKTIEKRTKERLDVWAEAFGDNVRKLMYVGHGEDAYISYAGELGLGSRQGFVEMYNYTVESPQFGFTVNRETRYSEVDESNPFIANNPAFGDENEEYTSEDRFGWKESFPYRYYVSTFRMLQQRRNYVMHARKTLNPELTWYLGYELSRKVENTPDAWAMLSEYYLSNSKNYEIAGPLKNIERWLYQRDLPGYETTPAVQVPTAKDLWYADNNKPYDYTARKGNKIGFNVDDRLFPAGEQSMAIKVTFYDGVAGKLKLVYKNNEGMQADSVSSIGGDHVRTATFFINARMDDTGFDHDFDFILESEEEVPVFFVRVIKTEESYSNTDQTPLGGTNHNIPGFIEAEHYDEGRVGYAYIDDDTKEGDLTQRPDDNVDIVQKFTASNGYTVGYTNNGEMLAYTVNTDFGLYDIKLYYYSDVAAGDLILSLDEQVIDTINGMDNKGSAVRDSITIQNVLISEGKNSILKLLFANGAGYEIDAIEFTLVKVPVTGVTLSDCPLSDLTVDDTQQLFASVAPDNASDNTVSWSSSNTSVATVNPDGLVTAVSEGNATISVTTNDGEHKASCNISVIAPVVAVSDVIITDCPGQELQIGDKHQLSATIEPDNATDKRYTWKTSDPLIAYIDQNGMVTALSEGSAIIDATAIDGGVTDQCTITISPATYKMDNYDGKSTAVKVYPNPASEKLYFEFPESGCEKRIEIYSVNGKFLSSKSAFNSSLELDVESFKSEGLLIVKVISGDKTDLFRVLIEK